MGSDITLKQLEFAPGQGYHILTDINGMPQYALFGAAVSKLSFEDTIATRDANTYESGQIVYVRDASSDPSVSSGWALYVLDSGVWRKLADGSSASSGTNPSSDSGNLITLGSDSLHFINVDAIMSAINSQTLNNAIGNH